MARSFRCRCCGLKFADRDGWTRKTTCPECLRTNQNATRAKAMGRCQPKDANRQPEQSPEHEARIAYYAARHAAKLPLFG